MAGRITHRLLRFLSTLILISTPLTLYAANPLVLTHLTTLNFGTAAKPTSGTTKIVVSVTGTIAAGTTATMVDTSSVSNGKHKIKGSGGNNHIQISFSQCASNSSLGLNMSRFVAVYGDNPNTTLFLNSATNLNAPGNGTNLYYGATLDLTSSTSLGHLSPCYNIDVDYD